MRLPWRPGNIPWIRRRLTIISVGQRQLAAVIVEWVNAACRIKRTFSQPLASGGTESLSDALAKLPYSFRCRPCYIILPKFYTLHKCIIHHPVVPNLRRTMLADAIEMDLPIKADAFAWDFRPLHTYDTDKRFLSYVFAERWYRVEPIYEKFLNAKIYPKGALVPLAIEFSAAIAARGGDFLQLCIDETTTSLTFTGGERPYTRCLPYGWARVLADDKDETQWDDWTKRGCAGNETLSEKVDEFFRELAAEIHTCELYYFHHLQGNPHKQMAIISSRAGSEFWIKFLRKHITRAVNVIHADENWKYHGGHGGTPDEITRMHLLRGAEMVFNGDMDNPSALVPQVVAQRSQQSRRFITKTTGCAIACGSLLSGNMYHTARNHVLQRDLADLRQKVGEERVAAVAIGRINDELDRHRARLEWANRVYSCQAAWTELFQELQDILVTGENGWLEELRVMPSAGDAHREITIGGCIQANEGEEIAPKFRRFFGELQKLPAVGSVGNLILAEAHPDAQSFQCTIALNSKYFQP